MSFAPPGEDAADLWFERSNFAGCLLGGVAYGMHVIVFGIAIYLMTRGRKQRHYKGASTNRGLSGTSIGYIICVCILFVLGTIQLGTNTRYYEMMWIDDRNFPGGPIAFFTSEFSLPVNTVGGVAFILADFLADAILVYRLFVVCNSSFLIIIFPVLALATATALNCLTIFQEAQPGAGLWAHTTVQFALPFWSFSVGLNILLSLAIAVRLVMMRRALTASGVPSEHGRVYTSIAAIIVESSALYSVTSLIYLICFARGSNVQNLLLPAIDQFVCIAPELISLRIVMGQSWTREETRIAMQSLVHHSDNGTQGRSIGTTTWPAPTLTRTDDPDIGGLSKAESQDLQIEDLKQADGY
ncbi:hypothetical protein SCHPADRAFT_884040 [Schizopora paradoxa]|uniref:Uncharacterized protein n=1 Tax=Schizopora paradoxa TaxID=27342 RepID=A0A0H2R081_9AGAM|nr:hypothetical protein SCHPADRAFT_884040 [Schizopora paradoxa]